MKALVGKEAVVVKAEQGFVGFCLVVDGVVFIWRHHHFAAEVICVLDMFACGVRWAYLVARNTSRSSLANDCILTLHGIHSIVFRHSLKNALAICSIRMWAARLAST